MRVFDLRCAHDHRFEGWFASSEAYDDQLARGLIACPVCTDTGISRLPSAPHLNLLPAQKSSAVSRESRSGGQGDGPHGGAAQGTLDRAASGAAGGSTNGPAGLTSGSMGASSLTDPAQAAANKGGRHDERSGERSGGGNGPLSAPQVAELQALWLNTVREVMRKTENVGTGFAEEARRMHYKEAPERAIRGVASPDQVAELADEGIDVISLPIPAALKEPLQ